MAMACAPVSESECEALAVAEGLQVGCGAAYADGCNYAFAGNYGTKGCYAYSGLDPLYAGEVFYGRDGTAAAQRAPVDPPKYRPHCGDSAATLEYTVSVELAPFAWGQLARSPGDVTVGTVRHSSFSSEEGVFFKPIPNRPWSGSATAGSDSLLGLKAAIPVTFTVPDAGEYMFGLDIRRGCDQFRLPGSTFDPNQAPMCLYPCDQCQRDGMSCGNTDSFFLCTSDPRSEPSNPATSLSLESCDKYIYMMGQALPRGRLHIFPAGENITVYLAARETCTVANKLLVYGRPNLPDEVPGYSGNLTDYSYLPLFSPARACIKSYPADLAVASICAFGVPGVIALWLYARRRWQRRRESGDQAIPLSSSNRPSTSDAAERDIHLQSGRSSEAARELRIRVSGASFALGWILTCYGLAQFIRGVQIKTYWENNALGPFPFWLILVAPGAMLLLLAILPTDKSAIRAVNVAMFVINLAIAAVAAVGLALVVRLLNAYYAGTTRWGTSVIAGWNAQAEVESAAALGCMVAMALINLRFFIVRFCSRPATPRATLRRLWAYVRVTYACTGAVLILKPAVPLIFRYRPIEFLRMQDIFCGTYGLWSLSYGLAGVTFTAFAALAAPKNRGRVYHWLAKLANGGTQLQQAAVIASLLGKSSSANMLARASLHFHTISFDKLRPDCFEQEGVERAHWSGQGSRGWPPKSHQGSQSNETLEEAGLPTPDLCVIGECDAFVSHAWIDEQMHRGVKYKALARWANASERPPKLWIDRICLGQRELAQTLPLLPLFIIGSNHFLMITGPAYSSRLWTILELFTFLQCNGQNTERAVVLPIGDVNMTSLLTSFDAHRASCSDPDDRDILLGLIEASFGDLRAFNKVVRGLKLVPSSLALQDP